MSDISDAVARLAALPEPATVRLEAAIRCAAREYAIMRDNFQGIYQMPDWDALEPWTREAIIGAYIRGKIDGLNED